MNEKENIIKALKNYKIDKIKAENLKEKIDSYPAESEERKVLESQSKFIEAKITIMERCLEGLTEDEKQVLKTLYIDREYRAADKIATRLSISRTNVYRLKNKALGEIKQMLS